MQNQTGSSGLSAGNVAALCSTIVEAVYQRMGEQASGQQGAAVAVSMPMTSIAPSAHRPAQAGSSGATEHRPGRSASCPGERQGPLPSCFMRRKKGKATKTKKIISYDRNIICLPPSWCKGRAEIAVPRGRARVQLAVKGLVGKVRLTSEMTEEEIMTEVCSVFSVPMGNNTKFPFKFLQFTGGGAKTLNQPSLSASFQWTASQVVGLSRTCIYIQAEKELVDPRRNGSPVSDEEVVIGDSSSEDEVAPPPKRSHTTLAEPPEGNSEGTIPCPPPLLHVEHHQITPEKSGYSDYCSLLDTLTNEYEHEMSDIEAETEDVQHAILLSLEETTERTSSPVVPVKHILSSHKRRVVSDEEQSSRIVVLRSQLWANSLIAFKRASLDVSKKIKVVFVGEPCEDEGGPLREFFTLLLQEIFMHSGLFEGEEGHVVPVHNTLALTDGDYYIVGKMIATSLIHGGRAPHCFSKAFSELLVYGKVRSEIDYEEVSDPQVRDKLKKLQECTDEQQLQTMIGSSDFDFRFDCGYFKASSGVKLADKPAIVRAIALHYLVLRNHSEIEQLRNGLRGTLDFGTVMKNYPDEVLSLLLPCNQQLTAVYLQELYSPVYSEPGSNKRRAEETVIFFWFRYIQDTADGQTGVSLEEILMFSTGTDLEPAMGFGGKIRIRFTDERRLPEVNTCALQLIVYKFYEDYEAFKETIDFSIKNSYGFGKV